MNAPDFTAQEEDDVPYRYRHYQLTYDITELNMLSKIGYEFTAVVSNECFLVSKICSDAQFERDCTPAPRVT